MELIRDIIKIKGNPTKANGAKWRKQESKRMAVLLNSGFPERLHSLHLSACITTRNIQCEDSSLSINYLLTEKKNKQLCVSKWDTGKSVVANRVGIPAIVGLRKLIPGMMCSCDLFLMLTKGTIQEATEISSTELYLNVKYLKS